MLWKDRPAWVRLRYSGFPVDGYAPPLQRDHIEIDRLKDHDVLRIETQKNLYQIRILCVRTRYVLALGGPRFKIWTLVKLRGTVHGDPLRYDPAIYKGRRFAFTAKNRTFVTSKVTSIVLCR